MGTTHKEKSDEAIVIGRILEPVLSTIPFLTKGKFSEAPTIASGNTSLLYEHNEA